MSQPDVKEPDLPDVLRLLISLQETMTSVNWKRSIDNLHVIPIPDTVTANQIREFFEEMKYLLPGYCDGCQEWVLRRTEVYWGAHPHLCERCRAHVLNQLDSGKVAWPQAHIPDEPQ